jgi:hypothetical protein
LSARTTGVTRISIGTPRTFVGMSAGEENGVMSISKNS